MNLTTGFGSQSSPCLVRLLFPSPAKGPLLSRVRPPHLNNTLSLSLPQLPHYVALTEEGATGRAEEREGGLLRDEPRQPLQQKSTCSAKEVGEEEEMGEEEGEEEGGNTTEATRQDWPCGVDRAGANEPMMAAAQHQSSTAAAASQSTSQEAQQH